MNSRDYISSIVVDEIGRFAIMIINSLNSVGQNLNEKLKTWMTVKMNEYRCSSSVDNQKFAIELKNYVDWGLVW